jgi:hypothetical protein
VAYSPFEEVVLPGIVVAARKASVPAVVAARKASVPVVAAAYLAVVEASTLEVVYSLPGGSALSPVLERRPILGSADLSALKAFLAAAAVAVVAVVAAVTIDVHPYRFTTFFHLLRPIQ